MSNDFTSLYARYYERIRASIERRVGNFHLSEELAQETFMRLLAHIEKLDGHNNIQAYLFTVAKTVVIDYYRSARYRNDTQPEILDYGTFTMIDDFAGSSAEAVDVRQALSKLPTVERDVLILHTVAGLTYDEIGSKHLKKSRHMSHYHLHWAKRHFAELYS